jgi:AraC-like DNA-binding protein
MSPVVIIWRELLKGVLSTLERMARLAECQDIQSGRYAHRALTEFLEPETASRAMSIVHELVWADWLSASLRQKRVDLLLYLESFPGQPDKVLVWWKEARPFLRFMPASATEQERASFTHSVEITTSLLSVQCVLPRHAGDPTSEDSAIDDPRVVEMVKLIHQTYTDPKLSLDSACKVLHISERHAARVFKACTGQTFTEYVRRVRIKEAAGLLTGSLYGVKLIASKVGYSDVSHFIQYFRETTGLTPTEFRKGRAQSA